MSNVEPKDYKITQEIIDDNDKIRIVLSSETDGGFASRINWTVDEYNALSTEDVLAQVNDETVSRIAKVHMVKEKDVKRKVEKAKIHTKVVSVDKEVEIAEPEPEPQPEPEPELIEEPIEEPEPDL